MRYIVKCDMCKKTLKKTNSMVESAMGGICTSCRGLPKALKGIVK